MVEENHHCKIENIIQKNKYHNDENEKQMYIIKNNFINERYIVSGRMTVKNYEIITS